MSFSQRFYSGDVEAERESSKRAGHRLLLAEFRDGRGSAKALIRNTVHRDQQAVVEQLVARAGLTAPNMFGMAQDAIRTLRAFADDHAGKASVPYLPAVDREAWGQSAEALRALADQAQGRLDAQQAA